MEDQPFDNCLTITDDFIKFSEDILNESCTSNVSIESTSDNLVVSAQQTAVQIPLIPAEDLTDDCRTLVDLESMEIVNDPMANDYHNLELIDCQIELMDQFKLTDHIDLSSNEIHLDEADDLFANAIVDLSSLGMDLKLDPIVEAPKPSSAVTLSNVKVNRDVSGSKPHRIPRFDPNGEVCETLMFDQWLESVVERVNNCMDYNDNGKPEPLVFSVCHVSIIYDQSISIVLFNKTMCNFQGFFNTLSTRFSTGVKRRLPLVSTIDIGSRTGLARFTWKFSNVDIINNIFKTKSVHNQTNTKF